MGLQVLLIKELYGMGLISGFLASRLDCQSGRWRSEAPFKDSYQNLTSQRSIGGLYTNNSDKNLFVIASLRSTNTASSDAMFVWIDGSLIGASSLNESAYLSYYGIYGTVTFIVPPGSKYGITTASGMGFINSWVEI